MKLEQLGEVHWLSVLENMSAFAEQHNRYRKVLEEVKKRYTSDHIKNALSLRQSVKDCLNLLEDILTKFSQCRWDVEVGIKRLELEAKKMKEIDGVISRKLRDAQRAEQRAERERNRQLDNLVNDIITTEAEIGP
ncbi:unnamed protein product [Nippostrongylus brasiliensis]|uniref:THO complex subunit 7 homolog n=1 Tax=Nippostrongylus brasiliensis TaxID=27835 RepID=A0A0N4XLS7_NIPBR|nr:unnamed protein product [Nippostrongylus brasiliensis]